MKRTIWGALAVVVGVMGVDRIQWFTGRVPVSNMVSRTAAGAPEVIIRNQLLVYHGTHQIKLSDLKPGGTTDSGMTYYRVHDWPEGMPGGWIYVPRSDSESYRYAPPTRPGWH